MYRDFIGKKSQRVKNIVDRALVRRFAESIGDPHQVYVDEEFGKKSRYGRNLVPPTFPRVFDYGVVEGLNLPKKGLIHGEQIYHYERPLLVGEELHCYTEVVDYYEKTGRNGLMGFLAVKKYGEDLNGNVIFTEEAKTIITESVRKAMRI